MAWRKSRARFGKNFANCYWRLTSLNCDFANKTVQLTFTVYADEAAAEALAEPLTVVTVPIDGADYDGWAQVDSFKSQAYARSASDPQLAGAVEV